MLVNDPKKALTATVMSLFVGLCIFHLEIQTINFTIKPLL